MPSFDPSQRAVLGLDPERHARVLGAPGSGKTRLIIETYVRLLDDGWDDEEILVIAPNRRVAAGLKGAVEERAHRVLGVSPVRTGAALAHALLTREAAAAGMPIPRLLTGSVHDELITRALEDVHTSQALGERFAPEVLRSEVLRSEVREIMRVLDDFALDAGDLAGELQQHIGSPNPYEHPRLPSHELRELWSAVLPVVAHVERTISRDRASELSASRLLRAATELLLHEPSAQVPQLIIVDDAQELREGELALISACMYRGSRVWVFGDPDIATGAFQGEHTRVLHQLPFEMRRKLKERGLLVDAATERLLTYEAVQSVVLTNVYRHGERIRSFVQSITRRIGAAGVGEQREATAIEAVGEVRFAEVATRSEQIGAIAHRLRQRRLGVDMPEPLNWGRMAVICRSRGEATKVARLLASLHVPTGEGSGGVVLRDHPLIHDLVCLLRHATGGRQVVSGDIAQLLTGPIGGIDRMSLRRLRGEVRLVENRAARSEHRLPRSVDDVLIEEFSAPGPSALIDSVAGRALRRLGILAQDATEITTAGGTPRETLWAIWSGTGLADRLQNEALAGPGRRADEAHRALDAVLGLFFVLQRHEEHDSDVPVADLLDEVLSSSVAEDSLAARSQREAVTVTTPQGIIGREFDLVCILGPQDGDWPNLKARGSLIGVTALEQWLRGWEPAQSARRDTLHDELRLFAHSCARATSEVFAVAERSEDQHPSAFFNLGVTDYRVTDVPSSRLSLRGAVAHMRRRVSNSESDPVAERTLARLAAENVPGARPAEWYGVRKMSTDAPLVDLDGDAEATVVVRPSHIESAERCALSWVIRHLGGSSSSAVTHLGTILHRALEQAQGPDPAPLLAAVHADWPELDFEADWESAALREIADSMVLGLADYLGDFEQSGREVVGREAKFALRLGRALVVGTADRLERSTSERGAVEVTVVDLKSGKTKVSAAESADHIQMQAYQMGVMHDAFELDQDESLDGAAAGGARLLYVHPQAVGVTRAPEGHGFIERVQPPLTEEMREAFIQRVSEAASVMAGREFIAQVEHHCSSHFALERDCSIHIVPAVSRA